MCQNCSQLPNYHRNCWRGCHNCILHHNHYNHMWNRVRRQYMHLGWMNHTLHYTYQPDMGLLHCHCTNVHVGILCTTPKPRTDIRLRHMIQSTIQPYCDPIHISLRMYLGHIWICMPPQYLILCHIPDNHCLSNSLLNHRHSNVNHDSCRNSNSLCTMVM